MLVVRQVAVEQRWATDLQAQGLLQIHATACPGLRECGKADIDNSCHWSSAKRYLCLMCALCGGRDRRQLDAHRLTDRCAGARARRTSSSGLTSRTRCRRSACWALRPLL